MTAKKWTTCRCCGSADLVPLFTLGEQWVSDFPHPAASDVKIGQTRHRVEIALDLCRGCTLVQQRWTAPQDFLYTRHYWYRSGVTATMRLQLRDVVCSASFAVTGLNIGDVWLDIGANDGTLLGLVPEVVGAGLVRVGVEPATNLHDALRRNCDVMIGDFWNAEVYKKDIDLFNELRDDCATWQAKVVTACGMLYDLEDPNAFVRDVAEVLHPDGVFVAQLQCLSQTVRLGDVGNFAHEHLEFYSLESLTKLYERCGLRIFRVEENDVNGGSYRVYGCHAKSKAFPAGFSTRYFIQEIGEGLHDPQRYARLYKKMELERTRCRCFVRDAVSNGKKVWVYGASTKGNVILQYYGLGPKEIVAAADRSPEKWGRTTANGIPIVSEEEFRRAAPDYALALPYAFVAEFREREAPWLRGGGKFLVPLPEFKVVS